MPPTGFGSVRHMAMPVRLIVSFVRPWSPLRRAMNSLLPVAISASSAAPSFASVPVEQKKLFCSAPGVMRASCSARLTKFSVR